MVSRFHVTLVLASVVAFLSLAAVITLIVLWLTVYTPFQDYALVVDAGSTHSKIFLYTWPADKSDGLGTTSRISQVKACEVSGGAVSTINISTQSGAKDYFNAAMTDCMNAIPSTRKYRTLIFLGATAGLRLMNISNPTSVRILLDNIRTYFSSLGVLFGAPEQQVRIIDGSEEGLSGWISANMLMGQLFPNNKPSETYGILDMGGASTQISFNDPNAITERYTMNLFNTNYDVYSHSYLCYGQEQQRWIYLGQLVQNANGNTLIDDPCLQLGYNQTITSSMLYSTTCVILRYTTPASFNTTTNITFRGTGDYTTCQMLILGRLNRSACSSLSNCSFDGVYEPLPISSSLKIIAISAFYSTFTTLAPSIPLAADANNNFNLASITLSQIYTTIQTICNQPWSNLTNPELKYRPFLCFYSMYHWTLIEHGYSMNDTNIRNFQIVQMINSNEIGWTLGYMINQTNYLDPQYRPSRTLTQAEFIGIIICFLVLLVISILILLITLIIHYQRKNSGKKYSTKSLFLSDEL